MFRRLSVALVALALAVQPASAQYSLLTSRAQVGGTGLIDWSTMGGTFTSLSNPFNVNVSNTALTATVSSTGGSFQRLDQGNGWGGNFANGDDLLYNNGAGNPTNIMFSGAVAAVGSHYMANYYGSFTSRISALDMNGNVLAFFDFMGTSDNTEGTAMFAGISSTAGNIWGVRYEGLSATSSPSEFAINDLSVNANVSTVPEPSTVALMTAGMLALGFAGRRRKRAQA